MNFIGWILLTVVGALIAYLIGSVIQFNLKRLHVIRCASDASEEVLEEIFRLIEGLGEMAPSAIVLGKTNRRASDRVNRVAIPDCLDEFPWKGRAYLIDADEDVHFRQIEASEREALFQGRIFRLVAVPRFRTKTGKLRNTFSPQRYFSASDELQRALIKSCPKYPMEMLSFLICSGSDSFEFEPLSQARIGASIEWVQSPEFPTCELCGRRMAIILQIPGTMLHPKRFHEGIFYLFGCRHHIDSTKSISQYY